MVALTFNLMGYILLALHIKLSMPTTVKPTYRLSQQPIFESSHGTPDIFSPFLQLICLSSRSTDEWWATYGHVSQLHLRWAAKADRVTLLIVPNKCLAKESVSAELLATLSPDHKHPPLFCFF